MKLDEAQPTTIEVTTTMLTGEHAAAYQEFCGAAADLEGKVKAAQAAQERYQGAIGRLSRLAAKAAGS